MNRRYFQITVDAVGKTTIRWRAIPEDEVASRVGVDLFVNYYDATRMLISRLRSQIEVRREEIAKIKRGRRCDVVETALKRVRAIRRTAPPLRRQEK